MSCDAALDRLRQQMYPPTGHMAVNLAPSFSAYLHRPSKIVRANSKGTALPRISRRKTTAAHSTTRPRHHARQAPAGHAVDSVDPSGTFPSARPLSWHPSNAVGADPLAAWASPYPVADAACTIDYPSNPFVTTEVNGLVTPLVHPSAGDLYQCETFAPLEQASYPGELDSRSSLPWSSSSYSSSTYPPLPAHIHPELPDRSVGYPALSTPFSTTNAFRGTAPPSPQREHLQSALCTSADNALCMPPLSSPQWEHPHQGHPAAHMSAEQIDDKPEVPLSPAGGDILVGMGLYDKPRSPAGLGQDGRYSRASMSRSRGKGLKLEETFEPPTPLDDASEEVESAEPNFQANDLTQAQRFSSPDSQPYPPPLHRTHPILEAESFFFDDDGATDISPPQSSAHYCPTPTAHLWTDAYTGAPCTWI